ncbi:SLAP domain-containing protein [Lactobacillus sp. UMNPBX11]|uniref:SLAP domain-containing protein n=1 Tax=Lactobacillus sp. UMNPBX11 TaxID=2042036 RepID=UPI00130477E5|nr:SLAP domain-containing protein [Lactobacillus sp. UMNPBX11]
MRYFRNDKLDLVNREKQRFGFRKLSSGKIASVLLGVTIFGSFALNGQVVKADTPTDGSQTSAAVDEPKSTQNNKGQGATATFNKEEQSRQDNSAQNYGSYNSLPITSEGGEETTEAGTGNPQAGSTGTDTQNANGGGTTSDTNGAGAAKGIRTRALVLAQYAAIPKDGQRTAQKQLTAQELVDKYKSNNLDLEHAQEFVDYYNNLNSITKILDLKATDYGSEWFERVLSGDVPRGVNNDFVKRLVSKNNEQMVKDTQAKIDKRIENLQDLSNQYPNNQEIKDAINNLRDAKNSVTVDNITNANAMKNAIGTLDKYGSKQAYDKLKQDAEKVNKDDLQSAVNEAATVKAANSQASEDKQKAYQDAIAAGKAVINDGKASQADVNTALSKIEQAKKDMTVSAIQKAVDEASDTKGKPNYYNASDEAKKAYNDALDKANRVLADPKATQDQLDEANSALTSAKEGLTGVATDNSGLEKAVNEAATVKAANSQASEDKQKAYQDAIAAGKAVINDGKASQADVNTALSKIEQAKKDMTVSAIQKAVDEASDTKGKPNYYNASDEAKKAYNDALDKANRVLADPKATQDQLDEANSALTSAKEGLTGVATDNSGLEKAVNEANTTKLDDKYYNASQDKKQAYDEALAQATKLLNDKNASQKAVAEAVANLEKAKAELNGEPNFIGGDYTPSEPSTPSTETPAEKTTEKILMHAAYLYDNKGIKLDKPTVKSYVTVVVAENPVIINGIKYYKVAGKDEYIKAENIDGTLRVITHNSYIYNNKGKATRNKGIKRLVKKTRIVRTYGAPINIKGHMMYRIGKNRYIKARNFEGTLRRLSHNSFVYDENGKATRNKGIRRLLKKSRVVRTFDAPVKIKGHMMYRVDNGYIKVKNIK